MICSLGCPGPRPSNFKQQEIEPDSKISSSHLAMATSDPATQAREAALRKRSQGSQIKFLIPLIYAPVLPLIRLSLRKKPVVRDRLFTAVLAGAFAHGFYLVSDLYDSESK